MASVFLSYDREDADKAGPIAAALERAGHSVWWDRHIRGGLQYAKEIEDALARADAVVVLWSSRSVNSTWVRDEAGVGRDGNRLVPIRLDDTEPPLGFRQFQTIDFTDWKGRARSAECRQLLDVIENLPGVENQPPAALSRRKQIKNRSYLFVAAIAVVAFLSVAAAG